METLSDFNGVLIPLFGFFPSPCVCGEPVQKMLLYTVLDFFLFMDISKQDMDLCRRIFFGSNRNVETNLLHWLFALFKNYEDLVVKENLAIIISDFYFLLSENNLFVNKKMPTILPCLVNSLRSSSSSHTYSPDTIFHFTNESTKHNFVLCFATGGALFKKRWKTDALLRLATHSADNRILLIEADAVAALLPFQQQRRMETAMSRVYVEQELKAQMRINVKEEVEDRIQKAKSRIFINNYEEYQMRKRLRQKLEP
jgi:hypothetical protein